MSGMVGEKAFSPYKQEILDGENCKVDEVLVAGCVKIERLTDLQCVRNTIWGKTLHDILKAKKPQGWCGFNPLKQHMQVRTKAEFSSTIEQLAKIHDTRPGSSVLLAEPTKEEEKRDTNRRYTSIRLVPKSDSALVDGIEKTLARVIVSCRKLNTLFEKSPKFALPSMRKLFRYIAMFADPHFAVLDFRHFFYQFRLPERVRLLFSLRTMEAKLLEFLCFPMGFSWAPFIGQGATSALLYSVRGVWAAKNAAESQNEDPQKMYEDFVEIRDAKGRLRAVMCGVYDNVLVVADSAALRDELADILHAKIEALGLIVKGGAEDLRRREVVLGAQTERMEVQGKQRDFLGWEFAPARELEGREVGVSAEHLAYSGLTMTKAGSDVEWRHSEKNTARWLTFWKECERMKTTARQVARVVGVIQYDAKLREVHKSEMVSLFSLCSKLGRRMAGHKEWDVRFIVSEEEWEQLSSWFGKAIDGLPRRWSRKPTRRWRRTIYLACDASDICGAVVLLTKDGPKVVCAKNWTKEDRKKSINWREAFTVVMAVEWVLANEKDTEDLRIVIAEDNTTALLATNNLYYPSRPDLCGRYLTFLEALGYEAIMAYYENTKTMPADWPSRVRSPLANFNELSQGKQKWQEWVNMCNNCLAKLQRLEADDTRKREREQEDFNTSMGL